MAPLPGPVKIGHKKDGRQRRSHKFHVSRPPLTRPLDPLLQNGVLFIHRDVGETTYLDGRSDSSLLIEPGFQRMI